jgi:succinate-semialdehyde dehydrogenase / glutarate-semialdehyde dehydrogenase
MPLISTNPATGRLSKRHRAHTPAQVSAAVAAAHGAFLAWRDTAVTTRARHLRTVAARLRRQRTALARLITAEMGKPLSEARAEIEKCAACCDFYAQHSGRFLKPVHPVGAPKNASVTFEPLGVVLAIMPWNYPFWQAFRAAVPAIMAGNAVLLKHASNVSGCALAIEKLLTLQAASGPSAALLRTLLVSSKQIPKLVADPRVRGVTLTGSTPAGRKVAGLAGAALKPVVLELGGSDPYIVLGDADLDLAAGVCATARLTNAGQSCIAAKRFIVVEKIRPLFEAKLAARLAALAPKLGPLARADLRTDLHAQVQKSIKRGARLLLGGKLPPRSAPGFFYPATLLSGVRPGMPAYDEELFGPVASVISARDEADALRIANDTPFGLGAALFSRNTRRARALARRLDTGMVAINAQLVSTPALPFGGTKSSGLGRELAAFGLHSFVNIKTLTWV